MAAFRGLVVRLAFLFCCNLFCCNLFCCNLFCCNGFSFDSPALAEQPADQLAVGVVGATGGVLSFATLEPRLDWPILLRRNDSAEGAREVRIDVTSLISPSGRLQEIKLQKDGAEFDGTLTLPALGQAFVHLVAMIPEEGTYNGEVGLVVGGRRQPVAIKVSRAVRDVVVAGTTGGVLQVTTPDPELNWPIVIRRNDNAPGPRDIGLELGNLIAPSGQVVKWEARSGGTPGAASISLQPLGQASLNLAGQLFEEGIYDGEIGLVVDGKRLSTTVKITRTVKDSSVRIEDISQVDTTIERAGVTMRLRLQEADGRDAAVDLPRFVRLDRKEGNASIQADYQGVKVMLDGRPVADRLVLGPRKTMDLALLIEGLNEAGNYSGTVRVSSANRKPVEKTFELSLHRCIWLAVILILAGVILSTGVRLYITTGRTAMVAQGDALTVSDDLTRFQGNNPDLTGEERRILSILLSRLDAIRRGMSDSRWGSPDTQVDEVYRKVEVFRRWIALRRRLDAVQPRDAGDAVREEHKRIAAILETPGAAKADTDKALAELETFGQELTDAIKQRLTQSITALRAEIAALPEAQKIALVQTEQDLQQALDQLGPENFAAAAATLAAARTAYVRVAIRALQAGLDPATPAPAFEAQAWSDLVTYFKRRLNAILAEPDAEQQIKDWNKICVEWLCAIAEPLISEVEQSATKAAAGAAADPNARNLAAASVEFEKAKTALQSIDHLLADKKVQEAMKAYAAAVTAYQAGVTARKGVVRMGAAAPVSAPAAGADIPPAVSEGTWGAISLVLGAPATQVQARFRVFVAEGLLFLVLLAVALVVGLKFLYFDNASWGSYTDMAVAFLWGFGLHQFAGTAFQGVQSIAQQLAGAK